MIDTFFKIMIPFKIPFTLKKNQFINFYENVVKSGNICKPLSAKAL